MERSGGSLDGLTRRVFVQRLSVLGGGVVLLGGGCRKPQESAAPGPPAAPGSESVAATRTFSDEQLALVTALVDRLLPRDADPGALDAGVPAYIDRALQSEQLRLM